MASTSSSSSSTSSMSTSSEDVYTGLLATLSQYQAAVPTETSVTTSFINQALEVSSQAVRDYCFRDFTYGTYKKWFTLDGSQNNVFLTEYPVHEVVIYGSTMVFGTVLCQTNGPTVLPTVSCDEEKLTLRSWNLGNEQKQIFNYEEYPTMRSLVNGINSVSPWQVNCGDTFLDYPSRFIKPQQGSMARAGTVIEILNFNGTSAKIIDEFTLELDMPLGRWVYVEWIAGYTLPIGTTQGTLPRAITQATINLAHDVVTISVNNGGLLANSETLGDYSYNLSVNSAIQTQVKELVKRQDYLLNRFKRQGWV